MSDDPAPLATPPRPDPPRWRLGTITPVYVGLALLSILTFALLTRFFLLDHWGAARAIATAAALTLIAMVVPGSVLFLIGILNEHTNRGYKCLHCGYPFDDLPEDSPCPECGTARGSEYEVKEVLDIAAIEHLVAQRDAALSSLLHRLPGRSILRVTYAEYPESRPVLDALADLHIATCGVELTLDDASIIHATSSCPPSYFLSLTDRPLDAPKRDLTSHAAWSPYIRVPLANIAVNRDAVPSDPLRPFAPSIQVPTDLYLIFHNGAMLTLSSRHYDPDAKRAADPGSENTLVVFGSERATLLGFTPVR